MKSRFDRVRPDSAAEAVALLARHGEGTRVWAGGTDMTLHWKREKVKLALCVDIRDLSELDHIRVEAESIRIGAMTSLASLERSAGQHHLLAMLSDITKLMCTPQTRTLATVGGNLCNASPAADLSPAFVALEAKAVILGPGGTREMAMVDFFKGVGKTDLAPDELLTEIVIPLPPMGAIQAAYRRIDRTVVDIALVNGSAAVTVGADGIISRVGIGMGAVAPVILNAPEAGESLVGVALAEADTPRLKAVAVKAAALARPISDVRASAGYRTDMLVVMVRRALEESLRKHREAA